MTHEFPTEPDEIPSRGVAIALIGTVVAIIASGIIVWLLRGADLAGGGRSDIEPPHVEPNPADPFHQELTSHEHHRIDQLRALDAWQWADSAHRRVKVPMSVAIDRYLEEAAR
jgi:hypothetical protein